MIITKVPRDGKHSTGSDRRVKAEGGDTRGGGEGGGVQEGVPLHLRLGDQGPPALRVRLQRRQCAECKMIIEDNFEDIDNHTDKYCTNLKT